MDSLLQLSPELWYPLIKKLSVAELLYVWKELKHDPYIYELFFVNININGNKIMIQDKNYPNLYQMSLVDGDFLQHSFIYDNSDHGLYLEKNFRIGSDNIISVDHLSNYQESVYELLYALCYHDPDRAIPRVYYWCRYLGIQYAYATGRDILFIKAMIRVGFPENLLFHFLLIVYVFNRSYFSDELLIPLEELKKRLAEIKLKQITDKIYKIYRCVKYKTKNKEISKLPDKYQVLARLNSIPEVSLNDWFSQEEINVIFY